MYDGVPLNDPFGGWVQWNRVSQIAVESVEVLRGGSLRQLAELPRPDAEAREMPVLDDNPMYIPR